MDLWVYLFWLFRMHEFESQLLHVGANQSHALVRNMSG